MILSKGTPLFRYCLGDNVPAMWSSEYHSPEYHSPKYGNKNMIGAFFFYKDYKTAQNVLGAAVKRAIERGESYPVNIITSCWTIADLHILDITGCNRPIQILNILNDNGIDVFTSDFVRHLNGVQSFESVRGYYKFINDNSGTEDSMVKSEILNYAAKIDDFFQWLVGYTGQLLTDFENGIAFKDKLKEKGYEGYQFMEEKTSPTVCLFDSAKLTPPEHTIICF